MQKDIHFYLTYALARKAGITADDAEKIAWSNQFTDDLTKAELHGTQTQSMNIFGNWKDRQIQRLVLVPFHFIPGDDFEHPWMVTANSIRARNLIQAALSNADLFQLGIALHTLQDTFSHQGFTGWDEPLNACYPWYYIQCGIPNIGHAEMQAVPDIVNMTWTDPRSNGLIDNKERAMDCAIITLEKLQGLTVVMPESFSSAIQSRLKEIFQIGNYDVRKQALIDFADEQIRYSKINELFKIQYHQDFITAASRHLSVAIELIKDLPTK